MIHPIWPLLLCLAASSAHALSVQVRWSVPEPRLVRGQVQRPAEHHALTVRLPADLASRPADRQSAELQRAAAADRKSTRLNSSH